MGSCGDWCSRGGVGALTSTNLPIWLSVKQLNVTGGRGEEEAFSCFMRSNTERTVLVIDTPTTLITPECQISPAARGTVSPSWGTLLISQSTPGRNTVFSCELIFTLL